MACAEEDLIMQSTSSRIQVTNPELLNEAVLMI